MNGGRFLSHFSQRTTYAGLTMLFVLISLNVYGLTVETRKFICPVDGTEFEYEIALSGTAFGKRLDFKLVGPIISPWPIPQCPTCGFVLYKDEFTDQELENLKKYILSGEYQSIPRDNTPYYFLAHIAEYLGSDTSGVGYQFLQASWQAEDAGDSIKVSLYLRKSLEYFIEFLKLQQTTDETYLTVQLLCGEIERRLSLFVEARRRFKDLISAEMTVNPDIRKIVKYQLELIKNEDSTPQLIPSD